MAVITVAAMVQTAVGFGFGLVSVPLLLWIGLPLPLAIALVIAAGCLQSAYGMWVVRDALDMREGLRLAGFQLVGMPLGILALRTFVDRGPDFAKQGVGVALLVLLTARLVFRPTPRDHVAGIWGALASSSSGFLSAALGIGGPPLVLFALAHRWDVARTRGFLWTQFVLGTPPLVIILAYRFGIDSLVAFAGGIALTPCIVLGAKLGFVLTRRWREATLSRAATGMLYAVAIASIAGPWISR